MLATWVLKQQKINTCKGRSTGNGTLHAQAGLLSSQQVSTCDLPRSKPFVAYSFNDSIATAVPESGKCYTLCGALPYMAPEVLMRMGHDTLADVWSLGVLVYELLHGTLRARHAHA